MIVTSSNFFNTNQKQQITLNNIFRDPYESNTVCTMKCIVGLFYFTCPVFSFRQSKLSTYIPPFIDQRKLHFNKHSTYHILNNISETKINLKPAWQTEVELSHQIKLNLKPHKKPKKSVKNISSSIKLTGSARIKFK